jgi:hypothetical protein
MVKTDLCRDSQERLSNALGGKDSVRDVECDRELGEAIETEAKISLLCHFTKLLTPNIQ